MNTITKITTGIIMLLNISFANELSYKLSVSNFRYVSPNVLEFDVYLLNNGSQDNEMIYFLGQYFFEFNKGIANDGTLKLSIVKSDLPENMRPANVAVFENQLRLSTNQINPNMKELPVISRQEPGTLIATLRLETSAKTFSNEKLDLKWDTKTFRTKIAAMVNEKPIEITKTKNHLLQLDGNANPISEISNELPRDYSLEQNFPNPFNPETKIKYELPNSGQVKLTVYDITGRELLTLVNAQQGAGRYDVKFNGSNFASGVYFYRIKAGDYVKTMRMVLIR